METCIYEVDYEYHSHTSFAFDEAHATVLVEAPRSIYPWTIEEFCRKNIDGFYRLNSFRLRRILKFA